MAANAFQELLLRQPPSLFLKEPTLALSLVSKDFHLIAFNQRSALSTHNTNASRLESRKETDPFAKRPKCRQRQKRANTANELKRLRK